jgi:hypothetical protein
MATLYGALARLAGTTFKMQLFGCQARLMFARQPYGAWYVHLAAMSELLSEGCLTHAGTFKGVSSPHSPLVGLFKTLTMISLVYPRTVAGGFN